MSLEGGTRVRNEPGRHWRGRHLRTARAALTLAPLLWTSIARAEPPAEKAPGETRSAEGAGKPAPSESPPPESDEKASEGGEPEDAETARGGDGSAESNADEAGKESKLPIGVATDEHGARLVAVHFRGEPGTRYFVGPPSAVIDPFGNRGRPRLDLDELEPMCASPCARWLYPGSYSLALSNDGKVARVPELLTVEAPAEVEGEYHSRWLYRTLGWATMGAGLIAGSLLIISSLDDCGSHDGTCLQQEGRVFVGAGAILVGLTGGLLLTQVKDEATASVRPASPALGEPR